MQKTQGFVFVKFVRYLLNAGISRFLLQKCDYLFILRPTLFFPVWTVFAAGYFICERNQAQIDVSKAFHSMPLIAGIAMTLMMGSAFIINQITDRDIDKENNKLFILADGYIALWKARIEAILLAGFSIFVAFGINLALGTFFVLTFLLTGILYSCRPFMWKDKALLGILANGLGAILIFSAGWCSGGPISLQGFLHAVPYGLAVSAVYLLTTLLDAKGDAHFGKLTFAVKYKKNKTLVAGTLFSFLTLGCALYLDDPLILYSALFSAPLFTIAVIRQQRQDIQRAIKFPILILALTICVLWPPFFVIIISTFYCAKLYYRQRFNINYPSFEAD